MRITRYTTNTPKWIPERIWTAFGNYFISRIMHVFVDGDICTMNCRAKKCVRAKIKRLSDEN